MATQKILAEESAPGDADDGAQWVTVTKKTPKKKLTFESFGRTHPPKDGMATRATNSTNKMSPAIGRTGPLKSDATTTPSKVRSPTNLGTSATEKLTVDAPKTSPSPLAGLSQTNGKRGVGATVRHTAQGSIAVNSAKKSTTLNLDEDSYPPLPSQARTDGKGGVGPNVQHKAQGLNVVFPSKTTPMSDAPQTDENPTKALAAPKRVLPESWEVAGPMSVHKAKTEVLRANGAEMHVSGGDTKSLSIPTALLPSTAVFKMLPATAESMTHPSAAETKTAPAVPEVETHDQLATTELRTPKADGTLRGTQRDPDSEAAAEGGITEVLPKKKGKKRGKKNRRTKDQVACQPALSHGNAHFSEDGPIGASVVANMFLMATSAATVPSSQVIPPLAVPASAPPGPAVMPSSQTTISSVAAAPKIATGLAGSAGALAMSSALITSPPSIIPTADRWARVREIKGQYYLAQIAALQGDLHDCRQKNIELNQLYQAQVAALQGNLDNCRQEYSKLIRESEELQRTTTELEVRSISRRESLSWSETRDIPRRTTNTEDQYCSSPYNGDNESSSSGESAVPGVITAGDPANEERQVLYAGMDNDESSQGSMDPGENDVSSPSHPMTVAATHDPKETAQESRREIQQEAVVKTLHSSPSTTKTETQEEKTSENSALTAIFIVPKGKALPVSNTRPEEKGPANTPSTATPIIPAKGTGKPLQAVTMAIHGEQIPTNTTSPAMPIVLSKGNGRLVQAAANGGQTVRSISYAGVASRPVPKKPIAQEGAKRLALIPRQPAGTKNPARSQYPQVVEHRGALSPVTNQPRLTPVPNAGHHEAIHLASSSTGSPRGTRPNASVFHLSPSARQPSSELDYIGYSYNIAVGQAGHDPLPPESSGQPRRLWSTEMEEQDEAKIWG